MRGPDRIEKVLTAVLVVMTILFGLGLAAQLAQGMG